MKKVAYLLLMIVVASLSCALGEGEGSGPCTHTVGYSPKGWTNTNDCFTYTCNGGTMLSGGGGVMVGSGAACDTIQVPQECGGGKYSCGERAVKSSE